MQHRCGSLFVVSTPIGNLGDISARALETLRSVDLICAEDTRHSRQLLAHFGIERPLQALHEHNEAEQADALVARLLAGENMALVSDAGTPLLSDPGFRLVRAARAAGVAVSPVPGASALLAALAVSGQPCDRFCFEGFLPAKAAARRERLNQLVSEPRTLVFYESAHRIEAMLDDLLTVFGADRQISLARELTKLFETVLSGNVSEVRDQVAADANQRRGEFVLVVAGAGDDAQARLIAGRRLYARLCEHLAPAPAARLAAELSGAPRKALYGGGTD
ncbi:MAG: 16S rRNA (cytidine(1402)-2'-O)-methyltransferase [Xanthomonadaceae bacterium]|nr:16S rRNA (cytidine(1402)-2'-O)-methyltransferase [Xanthomonadaceae bacterium]MDP2185226.1 16S rRNA (cytidine(1402)-2'-O)-methyltransferase [Xanthomonadales bacterium]MDZ4116383.1 16S rRNA (cytidine(1402)-2'-O)-methyltransferase [Xanthomonadaceae bacterium]MDZ4378878.1 16S rRNA (cytidine(1402)-2'-O)-methyltransferase [Xanthomonadaceae bacterium]